MYHLTIALAQVNQVWEDKETNLGHFDRMLEHLHPETDLILLPEMFHTAFTMNGEALAETMDDSMALRWLKQTAATKEAAIYTSFICRDNDKLYNRGVFVEPSGTVHVYDKRKTFGLAGENEVYASGVRETIVDYKGWKINLQICYDLRFPENVRNDLNDNGKARYDLLLYVANWPDRRAEHWDTLLHARAIENQCFVAGVNRVGTDANELYYSGGSVVFNALGARKPAIDPAVEIVQTHVLSLTELQEIREKLPFLIDSDYRSFNR
jgi:omega-amidase